MHCEVMSVHDVHQWCCIGAREEYSLLPMNKILVEEIHGVRRQLRLAVKLAYIYSATRHGGRRTAAMQHKCRENR